MGKKNKPMATDKQSRDNQTNIALLRQEVKYIGKEVSDIRDIQKNSATKDDILEVTEAIKGLVSKERFDPVQKIVYALVTLILTAFVTALIALVFKNELI